MFDSVKIIYYQIIDSSIQISKFVIVGTIINLVSLMPVWINCFIHIPFIFIVQILYSFILFVILEILDPPISAFSLWMHAKIHNFFQEKILIGYQNKEKFELVGESIWYGEIGFFYSIYKEKKKERFHILRFSTETKPVIDRYRLTQQQLFDHCGDYKNDYTFTKNYRWLTKS